MSLLAASTSSSFPSYSFSYLLSLVGVLNIQSLLLMTDRLHNREEKRAMAAAPSPSAAQQSTASPMGLSNNKIWRLIKQTHTHLLFKQLQMNSVHLSEYLLNTSAKSVLIVRLALLLSWNCCFPAAVCVSAYLFPAWLMCRCTFACLFVCLQAYVFCGVVVLHKCLHVSNWGSWLRCLMRGQWGVAAIWSALRDSTGHPELLRPNR